MSLTVIRFLHLLIPIACWVVISTQNCPVAAACAEESGPVSYVRDVAPVLNTYCIGCHGPDTPEGDLSLHSAAAIVSGGKNGAVLDRTDVAGSLLLKVLRSSGENRMPPRDEPQPTDVQRQLLERWIEEGAPFDGSAEMLLQVPDVPSRMTRQPNPVRATAIARDGGKLLVARNNRLTLIQMSALNSLAAGSAKAVAETIRDSQPVSIDVREGRIQDVDYSADGSLAAAATGIAGLSGQAVLFNTDSMAAAGSFAGHSDVVYAVRFSPDGQTVATAGYDRRILLHDISTGAVRQQMSGHNGAVFDIAFSPDGTLLASASADGTVKVWQTSTGIRMDTMSQPLAEQYCVQFSHDGRFVFAVGADSRIRRWQLTSRDTPSINPLLDARFAHEGAIDFLAISPDDRWIATASEDGVVKIWDAATLTEQTAVRLVPTRATSLTFAGGGLLVTTTDGKWQMLALPLLKTPAGNPSIVATGNSTAPSKPSVLPSGMHETTEQEPNNSWQQAQAIDLPAAVSGFVNAAETSAELESVVDTDVFRFHANKGQPLLIEVIAAKNGSGLDSRIEVLTADGQPVLQTQLQAVRDSYFTFRGKDSDTVDDFRLFNWEEMDLNQYLYADGEVVRLWMSPRGPDSGYKVYPGFGKRQTWFGTTATSHALQAPTFIVEPHPPGEPITDNGLPVFPVYFENDDDPLRETGSDSRLTFHPPADGTYCVRLADARGFQGDDFSYRLVVRSPVPDFRVAIAGDDVTINRRTGRELSFTVNRIDDYNGPVVIEAVNLPAGFTFSDPVIIESEQRQAFGTLIATDDAMQPSAETVAAIRFTATAVIDDQPVTHDCGGLKSLKLADEPQVRIVIAEDRRPDAAAAAAEHVAELTVYSGETLRAMIRIERNKYDGLVLLGKEDSGRNLPHGVIVDNIGLNGLMLLEGQTEREFFITAARWVPETSRPFFLKSNLGGGITSLPVMLHVRHRRSGADAHE